MSPRRMNRIQNLLLVALAVSAFFWVSQLFPLERMAEEQSSPAAQTATAQTALVSAVHLAITADSSYGRFGQLCTPTDSTLFLQVLPLLREAIGSAESMTVTTHEALQSQLSVGSVFVDFTTALPGELLAHWLDTSSAPSGSFTAAALVSASSVVLYLVSEDGSLIRCTTSAPAADLDTLIASCTPNSFHFAFETDSLPLAPYTLLPQTTTSIAIAASSLPIGCTAHQLLSAMGLNAYTNSRYTETGGAEVIVEGNHTLRITPDGTVTYQGDVNSPLDAADEPSLLGAWELAHRVADNLTAATGATALRFHRIQKSKNGWQIEFCYDSQSLPVRFSDGQSALSIWVEDGALAAFSYRCRFYRQTDSVAALLPPTMAAAIATNQQSKRLSIAYVDDGSGAAHPLWLTD